MAARQIVVAGQVHDVNADAARDLNYRIPDAEFLGVLRDAGMDGEDQEDDDQRRRILQGMTDSGHMRA